MLESISLMKNSRLFTALLTAASLVLVSGSLFAFPDKGESADPKKEKAKPYPLKTCLVSDEKLDADPGMKSFAFVHEGQEFKLCCKSCQKDFKKDTTKYIKKMKELVAKENAKAKK